MQAFEYVIWLCKEQNIVFMDASLKLIEQQS
jgi:hypothetical protein